MPEEAKLVPVATAAAELQEQLFSLKHEYLTKKTHVIDRLFVQQKEIESYFKIFYQAIDDYRKETLKREYELRSGMDELEAEMQRMLLICKKMGMVEFFSERNNLNDQMERIKRRLQNMGTYLPSVHLKFEKDEDMADAADRIRHQMTTLMAKNLSPVDQEFSMENYKYVTEEMGNDVIAAIYKTLGPFDYSAFDEKANNADEEAPNLSQRSGSNMSDIMNDTRVPQDHWEPRKSGAMFRGWINESTKRPDGVGIKVHKKSSMYEGYFKDGLCHGLGRGITSRGEVYQGMFDCDEMDGFGMFYWPDGRIYEGMFEGGKKMGEGRYFWPNGQVYEGEFKNDNCAGQGTLYYPDGKRYEGGWKEGNKHGKGTFIYPDGCVISVVYQEGRKTSEGKVVAGVMPPAAKKEEHKNLRKQAIRGLDLIKQIKRANSSRYGMRQHEDPAIVLQKVRQAEAAQMGAGLKGKRHNIHDNDPDRGTMDQW